MRSWLADTGGKMHRNCPFRKIRVVVSRNIPSSASTVDSD
jgi:hypothetical protein